MEAVKELKELLYEELELIARTTSGLIEKISPEDWDYRPREHMRSLQEIVWHLVAIPSVDLLILQEKSQEEVRALEAQIEAGTDKEHLIESMRSGLDELKQYMDKLSDEEFLTRKTKPFYLEHGSVQAKWLIEIVTHAQHHRAQLFTYMKQKGYSVTMFDLY
jgi:uncharacterized damage-inducible protein DinB